MAATRGQRSLFSAWGDFRHIPRVKLSVHTYVHLNLREAPESKQARWKPAETVFFPSHAQIKFPLSKYQGVLVG